MTLPSNFGSLFWFGAFCVIGGAWLTVITGVRTLPLREPAASSATPAPCANDDALSTCR